MSVNNKYRMSFAGLLAIGLASSTASAVVTVGSGGAGVTVGNSSLIKHLDISDTFTGAADGSSNAARVYVAAVQLAPAYVIENTHGNAARSWANAGFSFASDRNPTNPGFVNGGLNYPGNPAVNENTSGSGSITGFTQTGGGVDYGVTYNLRNKYVVQFDAVQTTDRVDIATSDTPGTIFGANGVSVFFRTTGHGAGEIGIFRNGVGETNSGLTSGIVGNAWNNYAVAFDRTSNSIEVFVNEVSRGVVNLNTFASGNYANFSTTAVSVGATGSDRTWTDNAQVGASKSVPGPASLVTFINFNESASGTGTAFDQAHNNNGTFQGSATRNAGIIGLGAARFNNAAADAVNLGNGLKGVDNLFSFNTGITIEALVTANGWTGTTQNEIFRKEDGGNRLLFSLQSAANMTGSTVIGTAGFGGISLGLNIGGVYNELDVRFDGLAGRPTVASFADGSVHHMVATYDSVTGLKSIFIDGELIGQVFVGAGQLIASGGGANAFIGSNGGGSEPWTGLIDEFAIYRSALTADEIRYHFEATRRGLTFFDTIVPEPTTLSLLALGGIAIMRRRRVA